MQANNARHHINTPGCAIPDYSEELKFKYISTKNSCGQRAVFVNEIRSNKLQFKIDNIKMKKYVNNKEKYSCCYQTINRLKSRGEDSFISYSPCINFKSGMIIKFDNEELKITCSVHYKNKSDAIIYDDVYSKVKKVKLRNKVKKTSWNVVLLGLDAMSRTRFFKTMPQTFKLIKQNGWLDYKGYHATSFENFPSLMAVLTGLNKSTSHKRCEYGMDFCINNTLWSKFKDAGYATAYGEDYVHSQSYTFSGYYGFNNLPTDHYMRPLFLAGETREDNILCTKKLPSVSHLLDYSFQFMNVYKRENHFGVFWHKTNNDYIPKLIDDTFVELFIKLNNSNILDNTFMLFMSNYGITHGDFKISIASYYEQRLPMLFIWVPNNFRKMFPDKYRNMQANQNRLISPYDVFVTLTDILELSVKSSNHATSDACPKCSSIFEKISVYRSCASASVVESFCTCHDVNDIDIAYNGDVLDVAVSHIKELTRKINTIPFTACANVELDQVLRINTYTSLGNEYFIIAFTMAPGNKSYEVLLMKHGKSYQILEPIQSISAYNTKGSCVIDAVDRPYCICEMTSPCDIHND
ncbi:hypothetical protein K1T71_003814 [Dendrolimus kikuchii]|uniref:Uncharacterized protein n=1 Tax=Dendrolimus kikuchii TaxID=765133 RepID=A0ACC1D9A7_9NEOP|nr:hypothetical protein K1T71_003814 [Dendrolimus kikuchii]